jgi:Flp pilus assembly protein protease CpaA
MYYIDMLVMIAATVVLVSVSVTDIRERRIPNRIMFPAIAAALLIALVQPTRWSLLAGGLVAMGLLLLPVFLYGLEKAGGGDVKLGLFIGLILGWPTVLIALGLASVTAMLFGLAGMALGRMSRKSTIAFAPFMAVGGLVGGVLVLLGG